MPIQDKIRKTWIGRVRLSGFPVKTKRGFKTKTAAKEWERKEKIRLTNPAKIPLTFSKASTEYLLYCQRRQQKNTYRQKAFIIKSLIQYWREDKTLNEIQSMEIEKYLDARFENVSGKSANRDLREINTLFNWLVKNKFTDVNPVTAIEKYKEEPFIKYVPPQEDVNKVMLEADPWEYAILQCIYNTNARSVEIRRMRWEDVDFSRRTIKLWTRKRRGGDLQPDELYINNVLLEILKALYKERIRGSSYVFPSKSGGQLSKSTMDNIMPGIFKRLNYINNGKKWIEKPKEEQVKVFGFHAIRHHVASLMVAGNELSLVDVQKQLRHKRATTTDNYIKSFKDAETKAADFIEKTQKIIPFSLKKKIQKK